MEIIRLLNKDFIRTYKVTCPDCGSIWQYSYEEYKNLSNPNWCRCPGCDCLVDLIIYREIIDSKITDYNKIDVDDIGVFDMNY